VSGAVTQALMNAADIGIVLSFVAATVTLVVYVWRSERRRSPRRSTRA
jgi:hypothetical protein